MHRILVTGTAMAIALGAAPAVAAASSNGGDSRPALHATSFSTPAQLFGLGPSGCTNLNPDTGRCLIAFFQHDTLSGDIVGQNVNAGSLSVQLPALTGDAVSLSTFRGTVRGCPGPGTATLRFVVRLGARPGHNIGTVEVVEGAGSGGLATLEGRGHVDATPHPDGTVTGSTEFNLRCTQDH
jgi:hypothetical protein